MKKTIRKKWVAGLLALSMVIGTVGTQWVPNLQAASNDDYSDRWNTMSKLEQQFAGYMYEDPKGNSNINDKSVLIGDADVANLENAKKYAEGNYTSLADYLYSFNSAGELVRDTDYSYQGNKKTGFLYYKTPLTDFTLSFEYKHGSGKGWNGVYVGMGASAQGKVWANESGNFAMFLETQNHHALNGSTTNIKELETDKVNYQAASKKYSSDNNSWFSYKLTVKEGLATWYIDDVKVASYTITGYKGGYVYLGAMTNQTSFRNITLVNEASPYSTMTGIEQDFTAAFYDNAATNLGSASELLTDPTKMENAKKYKDGDYSSLADWLYSVNENGELVRDNDYGTSGNRKQGFLYFDTKMKDFTLELEYKHGMDAKGWRTTYIGFGAQAVGNHYANDKYATALQIQPEEMYLENQSSVTDYKNWKEFAAIKQKFNDAKKEGKEAWYQFKLTVKDGTATWWIDGQQFSKKLTDYVGGYLYIATMAKNTAFRNMKITKEDANPYETYDVYYAPNNNGVNVNKLTGIQKTDFENCWSLENGIYTRTGSGEYAGTNSASKGASMLYFNQKKYKAFEMETDYFVPKNAGGWRWFAVGFGADTVGSSYIDGDGYMVFVENEGYVSYLHPKDGAGYKSDRISSTKNSTYQDGLNGAWHHAKIRVADGKLSISYDDGAEHSVALTDYEGYVYLCSFTQGMQFKNVSIKEVTEISAEIVKQFTAYYLPNDTDAYKCTEPLKKAEVSDLWLATGDTLKEGTLTRNGSGVYAAANNRVKGPSMLYFDTPYTNFVLSYDFNLSGQTGGWKWVGAGFGMSEKGKYFGDNEGYFAFIEQEGYRSLYTGNQSGRIGSAIENYQKLLSAGDQSWHHLRLVVKGNVAEIYLDNYEVAKTTISDYQGGYVYLFSATQGMKMSNIELQEISYIASTQTLQNLTVQTGTDVNALGLPTSISTTLHNGQTVSLPVKWDVSNYNANVAGKYAINGTIEIEGTNLYQYDSGRNVKVLVTVAGYDTSKVTEYNFNSTQQLNETFVSYYVGADKKVSADSELKQADASLTWLPTENGGIKRTGSGEYRASTSGNMAGALLYFKEHYQEFELDFDYEYNGTVRGWRWMSVGVGAKEYGKTAYQNGNGTMAVVEMEGQIRSFTNNKSTLLTDKNAFNGYAETLSEAALSLSTVHHMRVAVKNARMYVYVDHYPVADIALNDYDGGYVYLYGFTENLELSNIRISNIVTGTMAQEAPYKSVKTGTKLESIQLPEALNVTIEGKTVKVPVTWNSPDYDGQVEGTYNFFATPTGMYSHLWLSQDAKRLHTSVTVGNTDEKVVQNFSLTSTEELDAYFTTYYTDDKHELFDKEYWNTCYAGAAWKVNTDGVMKRTGKSPYGGGPKGTYGVSALYYNKKMENFEVEFDYRHGQSGWKWVSVMFGVDKIGDTYGEKGYLAFVEQEGKVRLKGSTSGEKLNFSDPFPSSRYMDGYSDLRQAIKDGKSDEWFHYRLVVANGTARVYVNGELWSCTLAEDYKGGYVALSLNSADTLIKNLSITNYDAKEITLSSVQDTKEVGADYIEIDKTKGDTLSLPNELLVTDTDGYTYRMQIDWVNKEYRSGKLGTYQFIGNPVLPSAKIKNPNKVAAVSTVKVKKVDYNAKNTVKYYFDNENDMLDFTDYYSANTAEAKLAESDWKKHWSINSGELQRINDNFSNPSGDKFGTYRKMSRLTYNKELKGNYQIDVDYLQDTGTYMWAMICFATSDKTQFVVDYDSREQKFVPNTQGGTAVYLEKEGSVNFWGNMDNTNLDGVRLRLLDTAEKFVGYDSKEMHHMTVTVIDGVARVFIDQFETNVAIRVPDEALGGYVSLMSNSNAVTFDNFAITQLSDDFKDGNVAATGDTSSIAFTHKNDNGEATVVTEETAKMLILIPTVAITLAGVAVITLFAVSKKKKVRKEEKES